MPVSFPHQWCRHMNKPDGPLTKDDRLYMGLVENPRSPESRVDDFAAFVLHILNYDNEDRAICQRTEISFPIGYGWAARRR